VANLSECPLPSPNYFQYILFMWLLTWLASRNILRLNAMLLLSLWESILIYFINTELTQQWMTWRSVYTTHLNVCGCERRCLNVELGIFWQRRKRRKTDSHSLGRTLNLGSPAYGMQTTFFSSLLLLKCYLTALSSANITQRRW